jgi:hypothetical protein
MEHMISSAGAETRKGTSRFLKSSSPQNALANAMRLANTANTPTVDAIMRFDFAPLYY